MSVSLAAANLHRPQCGRQELGPFNFFIVDRNDNKGDGGSGGGGDHRGLEDRIPC